jgi:serine/threonine protein kinase
MGDSRNSSSINSIREYRNQPAAKDWDQISLILELTGTPSIEELRFITDKSSTAYLRSFERKPRKNLAEKYPYSSPSLVRLMEGMLQFDPSRRLSVKEALSNSYFDTIRDLDKEKDADFNLRHDFEENEDLTCEELRPYFLREILEFT